MATVSQAVYSLYDTSWVASERLRLQNTAENTTYSADNMLARDMQMMAITNRGMIANQVMVGQAVALTSWNNYPGKGSKQLAAHRDSRYDRRLAIGAMHFSAAEAPPGAASLAYRQDGGSNVRNLVAAPSVIPHSGYVTPLVILRAA